MKGFIEEYGTFILTAIIALGIIAFLIPSITSPQGALHRFAVVNMESVGAKTQVVVADWEIGSIKVVLKDDGGLYFTGTGKLPEYASVKDTPWASYAKDGSIIFVDVDDGIEVPGTIPIN